jgi:LysM repeat protein
MLRGHASQRLRRRLLVGATLVSVVSSLVSVPGLAHADPVFRVVRSGECLSELAEEYEVTVEDIRRWNDLRSDVIHIGQRLIVGHRDPVTRHATGPATDGARSAEPAADRGNGVVHEVRRGETLSGIASRYGVDLQDVLRWNKGLRTHSLSIGRRLTVHPRKQPPSESIGRPYGGSLANGRRLQPYPAFVIRDPTKAWGTEETVQWISDAFDEVRREHARAPRVRVHDLSLREGGPIPDHRSHESGRDVDITYFQRRCPRSGCELRTVAPREMLVAPQWTLISHWIRRGVAQVIFVDYDLQPVLYRYAQRRGATAAQLAAWFQYPRGRHASEGIIRHAGNHRNHLHVRFVCPRGDHECRY